MSQLERVKENGKKARKSGASQGGVWHGFVDIPLSKEDKERLADSAFDVDALVDIVEEWVNDGYKVSLTPDPKHNSTIATLTGVGDHCPNLGYSLSGRGPSVVGALASLAYKHDSLAGRGVWTDCGDSRDNSTFG